MRLRFALALLLVIVPAALAGSGSWHVLPAAPITVDAGLSSVWTGREMIVSGVALKRAVDGAILQSANVAVAYDPRANTWRALAPPPQPTDLIGSHHAVWTGKEVLVWGPFSTLAFNPLTNRWRQLRRGHGGLVVWTGRELIGWGGGCCGDAFSDGVAYNPSANRWRNLPRSPLAGSQSPLGAWAGRELFVFVGNLDPDGKPWPARLARAAAYNPAANTWRRVAALPAYRGGASAVWDGREILVVGGAAGQSAGFAYDPATNRWRRLPCMEPGRAGAAAVWTAKRLVVWGGVPARGFSYDPKANHSTPVPPAPIPGRLNPTAVWTGSEMIVWGGAGSNKPFADGAAFRPGP